MSNDKLTEQLNKLKEALAKWEKELVIYSKWAIDNDGVLTETEKKIIDTIKAEILAVKNHISKIESAKGLDKTTNSGKTFTADPKKSWNFGEFQKESEQVVVDKTKLTTGQIAYFETYEKVAQTYINRMAQIYEGKNKHAAKEGKGPVHKLPVPITGKMLADAALKTFIKYGNDIEKVVPVELMLAQCQCETHFGTVIKRKGSEKSPFNVGVYDSKDAGFLSEVENMEEGIEMYYDLMAEDYLSSHNADELDDNFVNERGQRYASATSYEEMMKSIEGTVKSVSAKNGIKMPNPEDLSKENTESEHQTQADGQLSASVGEGGVNKSEDVRLVKDLLNKKINAGLTLENSNVATKTIEAIKKFQISAIGKASGLIEPGSESWKALSGSGTYNPVNTGNTNSGNSQNQGTAHNKDLHLYGAETDTEKKLEEFAESFNDIQVRINPGQEPAVFEGVRPPYFMNSGERAQKANTNRKNYSAVDKLIKTVFGQELILGKATPPQIKEFLEESIKKNLISDKTNKGMRKFLEDFGVSTDCSGLAVQAMNFLLDGDFERNNEEIGIQSTGMMEDDRQKGLNYKTISSPSGIKAGDLMLNYKQKGTDTYHVRVILDVDTEGEAVLFTTIESAASSSSSEDGTGIGQKRWKFPKSSAFQGLQKYSDSKKMFQDTGASDQAYVYVRHKKLDK